MAKKKTNPIGEAASLADAVTFHLHGPNSLFYTRALLRDMFLIVRNEALEEAARMTDGGLAKSIRTSKASTHYTRSTLE